MNDDELTRRDGESELDYHKRLVYGKLVDKTLNDVDYAELSPYVYGKSLAPDEARKRFYGSRYTLELMEREGIAAIDDSAALSELDTRMAELRKERQKFYDQRTAYNKMLRDRSRAEELNEIIVETVQSGNLPQLQYVPTGASYSDNDLLVSLNDIHYGANINNYWNTYNSDVCREMMCKYLDRIIAIGAAHDSEKCYVLANGDAISGNIHFSVAVTNKENVIQQVTGVSELIAEFLAELSRHFREVIFESVAGNHSRIQPDKNKALIDERLDDLVGWYLEARLQNFENITIGGGEKIDSTMYALDIRGKTYLGIHGDLDSSPSNIQTLQTMAKRPVYAVLSGHKHHNKIDEVQGVKTLMAGSFIGMDGFCVEKRIVGKPQQLVCVCDDGGVRCAYDIDLNGKERSTN